MVDELNISPCSRSKLELTLKKFLKLFGGGLGLLDIVQITTELKPDVRLFNGRYYSTPKAFEQPLKKEVDQMCSTDVLKKLLYDDDSHWV